MDRVNLRQVAGLIRPWYRRTEISVRNSKSTYHRDAFPVEGRHRQTVKALISQTVERGQRALLLCSLTPEVLIG
jgi:hypothetical protein